MMERMCPEKKRSFEVLNLEIHSHLLHRKVLVDIWKPAFLPPGVKPSLLLINDGQDMPSLKLGSMLEKLQRAGELVPLVCVGIHAGEDRRLEYGTAGVPDYLNRGNRAAHYTSFVFEELLPTVRSQTGIGEYAQKMFAGFSLGGLSALDIVWAHPHEFTHVGVFSGSLWWRTIDQDDPGYDDDQHRIMHQLVRNGSYAPWLKFFFMTGTLDETNDRNNNGIIDSIDDTLGLMQELERKGYDRNHDMVYLELADGRHDVATWARAMPQFLRWISGK